jgi:hypothetical protein
MNAPEAPDHSLRHALVGDHARIEHLLARALHCSDDDAEQIERWHACATLLREHLELEEMLVLPAFELAEPILGRTLLEDHEQIHLLLAEIGLVFELRVERDAALLILQRLLREHHRRETRALYESAIVTTGERSA